MKLKYWCFRDDCPIELQYTHDLRWSDLMVCLYEIKRRALRDWAWPLGCHFTLNATDAHGTVKVLCGNLTHNGKILIEV